MKLAPTHACSLLTYTHLHTCRQQPSLVRLCLSLPSQAQSSHADRLGAASHSSHALPPPLVSIPHNGAVPAPANWTVCCSLPSQSRPAYDTTILSEHLVTSLRHKTQDARHCAVASGLLETSPRRHLDVDLRPVPVALSNALAGSQLSQLSQLTNCLERPQVGVRVSIGQLLGPNRQQVEVHAVNSVLGSSPSLATAPAVVLLIFIPQKPRFRLTRPWLHPRAKPGKHKKHRLGWPSADFPHHTVL